MYRVDWLQSALDEVTILWMRADSSLRQEITQAVYTVDQLLTDDPEKHGESRSGNERIVFVDPLAVFYRIEQDSGIVTILRVRQYPE